MKYIFFIVDILFKRLLEPRMFKHYYEKGIFYYKLCYYSAAIDNFDKALEVNPEIVEAYINRGICNYRLANLKEATQDFLMATGKTCKYPDSPAYLFLSYKELLEQLQLTEEFHTATKKIYNSNDLR